jgi:subfamily B ATP-binding cassette protein MsbA
MEPTQAIKDGNAPRVLEAPGPTTPEQRTAHPSSDRPGLKFYLRAISYFRPDLALILLLLALTGVSIVLGLLQAWPLAIIIDCVLTTQSHARHNWINHLLLAPLPTSKVGQIIGITVIGMFMKVAQDGLTWARNILNNRINNWGVMRLRDELYERIAGRSDGDSMYRLINDAQGPQIILNVLLGAAISGVTFVLTAAVMLSRSVPLTLYALTVAPALVLINLKFDASIRSRTTAAKETESHMVSLLAGPRSMGIFRHGALATAGNWLSLNQSQEAYWFLIRTVFSIGGAIIFGYGGYLAWQQQFVHPIAGGMTVGTLAVFMDYLGRLWDPMTRFTGAAADIQPGVAGAKRVFEVLDEGR